MLLDWFADPANFAEALITAEGAPLTLDPWQAGFLRSPSRFTVILKSRRVGGSWIMAARMFIRAVTRRRYSGVFVSLNREEARGKIDYAAEMNDSLPPRWRLRVAAHSRDEITFTDAQGRRSTLTSLAAKAPRGRGGDVGISELPHCHNSRAIYDGALHVTARSENHQLTIESTPLGKRGVFYNLARGHYPQFERLEVPWWQCAALCSDTARAALEAPAMTTPARVAAFGSPALRAIHASMPEHAFRQESELEFVEIENAAFPVELLAPCAQPDYAPMDSKLIYHRVHGLPAARDFAWLAASRKGILAAGYDPARSRDRAAMVILDIVNGRAQTRMAVSMDNVPFADQQHTAAALIRHGVTMLCVDATGVGMDIAERLQQQFPSAVKGVRFTAAAKSGMIAAAYTAFSGRLVTIPADRELMPQLASIREQVTESAATLFHTPRGAEGHGDLAWAFLLAVAAWKQSPSAPETFYQPLARRASPHGEHRARRVI